MKYGVRIKLDVSKIDKSKLFRGQKGVYLDATVFIDVDQKDQYDNNGMITQDVTKEEKAAGQQGPILGNVQVFWSDGQQQQQMAQQPPQRAPQQQAPQYQQSPNQNVPPATDFDSDIPW